MKSFEAITKDYGKLREALETAGRLPWRDKGCSSRVCRKGNFILTHALALSNRRDVDH